MSANPITPSSAVGRPPSAPPPRFNRDSWAAPVRFLWYGCALVSALTLLGALPVYFGNFAHAAAEVKGLSGFSPSLPALIGWSELASSWISYALALLLFWRRPSDRMALFASFFFLYTAVAWAHSLDYFLAAYFGAPSTYKLWSGLSTPAAILLLCVFPDGHFVPRWTRRLFLASIPTSFLGLFGGNWTVVSNFLTFPLFFAAGYAQLYRYRRVSSYAERQQTRWWVLGLAVSLALSLLASLLYRQFGPPLLNVTPIFLAIAILRSRLWDIDIIIRRTLIYSILTAILAVAYLSSVILLQQVFRLLIAGGGDLAIIISTLAIAAVSVPVRNRVQRAIDRRFYRRKYDAAKVLAAFGATARDEVDLQKLTESLMSVVQETMQPASVSVWVNETDDGRQKTMRDARRRREP